MSFVSVGVGGGALLGGALAGGGSLLSGALGYFGAKSASDKQAQAAQQALDFQKQVYADNQPRFAAANSAFDSANLAYQPWLASGQSANYTLSNLLGNNTNNKPDYSSFFNSPDYQFAQSQGQRGTINAANAQGVGLSGGTLKDLSEFNSGLATQQYGNYFQRLMAMSGVGLNAAGGITNIAGMRGNLATGAANSNNTAAGNIGNTFQGIGQAQAGGIVGGTNAITGGINNAVSNSLLYNSLNRQPAYTGTAYLPTGSSIPGASGPTSVGGAPLNY